MDEKLFKLEGLMKTEPGKELARERTRRLREWKGWWDEEVGSERMGNEALEGMSVGEGI